MGNMKTDTIEGLEDGVGRLETELEEKRAHAERLRQAGNVAATQAEEAARAQARALVDNDEASGSSQADIEATASRTARNAREAARLVERDIEALTARLASGRIALEAARAARHSADIEAATARFLATVSQAAGELESITSPAERVRIGEEIARAFGQIESVGMASVLRGREWRAPDIVKISLAVAVGQRGPVVASRGEWDGIELGPMVAVGLLCGADVLLPPPHLWISAPAGHTLNVPELIAERLIKLKAATRLLSRNLLSNGLTSSEQALEELTAEDLEAHRKTGEWRSKLDFRRHVNIAHPRTWPATDAAAIGPSRAASSIWNGTTP